MKTFTSTHTHPLNIVRVTSSALQKIEKHPHSWTFTSIPPPLGLGHCPYDVNHIPGGGGVIGPGHARTLCCIGYSINITNLVIVGIVRPKLLSARLTQTIIRRRHSSCSGLTPALGKPCSLLDRLYFLFFS